MVLLSKDTDNYGVYGKTTLSGLEEYWDAVKDVCVAGGMTEEDAGQYVRDKKLELRIKGGPDVSEHEYSFEMYRELIEAYAKRMISHTPGMLGQIPYRELLEEDKNMYPPYEDWKEIAAYQDRDGFLYIHQEAWMIRSTERTFELEEWGFPEQFKILLYGPEEERYAVSDVWTTDHLLSEYLVTADKLPDGTVAGLQVAEQSKSERVPWWIIVGALIMFVGSEVPSVRAVHCQVGHFPRHRNSDLCKTAAGEGKILVPSV